MGVLMPERMPLATRRAALELGARLIEADLDHMRRQARRQHEEARERSRKPCPQGCTPGRATDPESEGVPSPCRVCDGTAFVPGWDGRELPLTTSLEGDLLKAVEWASAAATLRAMAAQEPQR
jgi:hypothetical protein